MKITEKRRKGKIELSWFKDDNCEVRGICTENDESFDHEFGTHNPGPSLKIDSLTVCVYILQTEYDITKALSDSEMAGFKEEFLEHVYEKYKYDLVGD